MVDFAAYLGPHSFYIILAYAGVGLLTLALILATFINAQRQKSRLKALEARGHRRRSDKKTDT